ncbi:4309_t:CDS:2, partial [Scutellospora calospora]
SLATKYVSPEDDDLTLPSNICEPIARLYKVLHTYSYIYKLVDQYSDVTFSIKMTECLERHWKEWEQPLLILSYLLHPDICLTQFNLLIDSITFAEIGRWVIYYYYAWFGDLLKKIIAEIQDYQDEVFPFSKNKWNQFEGDILKYWKYCAEIHYKLSSVALRLHDIFINSISVERLFSSMGFFHTKKRNRLSPEKVFNMSKLRISMLYKNRIEKIKNNINFINSNFAPPITKSLKLDDDDELSNEASRIDEEEDTSQLYEDEDELDMADSTTNLVAEIREVLRKQKEIEFIRNESTAEKENRTETEDSYKDSVNSISEEFMEED